MSFVSSAFGGVQNQFTPESAYKPGTKAVSQDFAPQIGTANTNYGSSNSTLDALTQAIMSRVNGSQPSLSGQLLQNATGQNVANTAAAMAGQRGASQNVGLLRRQIAQQGAGIQQQAAGQAATNQIAENQANINAGTNIAATQGNLANSNLGIQQNALANQNSNILSDVQGRNKIASDQAAANASSNSNMLGGLLQTAGTAAMFLAKGGQVPRFSGGGQAFGSMLGTFGSALTNSNFGNNFTSGQKPGTQPQPMPGPSAPNMIPQGTLPGTDGTVGVSQRAGAGSGIRNPGGMDPGQGIGSNVVNIPQSFIQGPMPTPIPRVANGGMMHAPLAPMNLTTGGPIAARAPQERATVAGNSVKNDKIPAMVSEDEIVLPREVTMHPNAPAMAAKYVMEVMKGKHKVRT